MTVTIYHNPRCSKSRATMEFLEEKGIEAEVIKYPNRYKDERGAQMWSKVIEILERVDKN